MNCLDCDYHKVMPDVDPDDWFCDDDKCVICTMKKNDKKNINSKWMSDRYDFKSVTRSCRPYNLRKESAIPSWCPKKDLEE